LAVTFVMVSSLWTLIDLVAYYLRIIFVGIVQTFEFVLELCIGKIQELF